MIKRWGCIYPFDIASKDEETATRAAIEQWRLWVPGVPLGEPTATVDKVMFPREGETWTHVVRAQGDTDVTEAEYESGRQL